MDFNIAHTVSIDLTRGKQIHQFHRLPSDSIDDRYSTASGEVTGGQNGGELFPAKIGPVEFCWTSVDLLGRDNLQCVETRTLPATWKAMFALVFCVSFLTIQIIVPITKLRAPRPARFGWHMWVARKTFPRFFVVLKDGTTKPADLSSHIGLSRGEMDFAEELPPHLCRVLPDITAVQIKTPNSDILKVHTCR